MDMPPERPGSQAPKGNLVFFERMISVKKLLAVLMTMAIAVVLGMGTVGCSKKDGDKDKKPVADAAAKDKDKDAAAKDKDKDAAPKDKDKAK